MAIYIIFVPVGVFVWDGMGSLPQELRELPSDNAALISWGVTRSCFKHSNGRRKPPFSFPDPLAHFKPFVMGSATHS